MKANGTRRHLIWSKDKKDLISLKVEGRMVTEAEGRVDLLTSPPEGQMWLIVKQAAKAAGWRVIADQWECDYITISTVPDVCDPDNMFFHVSVTAKHPLGGTLKVKADGPSISQAKSRFWDAWKREVSSTGVHSHLSWAGYRQG